MEWIKEQIQFILNNKEWIFSGLGLSVLGAIGWIIKKMASKDVRVQQIQQSGDGSTNYQSAGKMVIKKDKD